MSVRGFGTSPYFHLRDIILGDALFIYAIILIRVGGVNNDVGVKHKNKQ